MYAGEKETQDYIQWVREILDWSKANWTLILGPFPTMREYLAEIPKPTQIIMWHRTFIPPNRQGLNGWLDSLTPIFVYNNGGKWYGPTFNDRGFHNVIDAHSSLGDISRLRRFGLHKRISGHPGITGTQLPLKVLKPLIKPNHLVIDPMAGIGSILIAAQRLGCRIGGFEINKEWAQIRNNWLRIEKETSVVSTKKREKSG